MWTNDAIDQLRGCMEATDWNVFFDNYNGDIDFLTDSITSYVMFCLDSVIPTKTVRVYTNNKPWLTKELKQILVHKKYAFMQGNKIEMKSLSKQFQSKVKTGKAAYKEKMEERFCNGNAREAWKGLNVMMGRKQRKSEIHHVDSLAFANEINIFFSRFDKQQDPPATPIVCEEHTHFEILTQSK